MKTVMFVRNGVSPRLFNEAYALKQSGKYNLFLKCKTFDEHNMGAFHEVFSFSSPPHIDIINCCGTYPETEQVLRYAKCPVVMDLYDGTSAVGIENLSKERYERDKYCFENVSGILYRGSKYEIPYYKKHGYDLTCPTFIYEDYCNKKFFANNNKKLSSEDREVHVVDMGGGYGSPYAFITIRKFIEQKIHFHLYLPAHVKISLFRRMKYIKLDRTNKYFHLEKPLPFEQIHNEISKYDFGSIVQVPEFLDQHYPEYLKIASAYRIFTYLDAGLPIVVSDSLENIKRLVVENKVGFSVEEEGLDDLHNIIDLYDYEELRENVFRAREELLIDNHVERLNEFYNGVIN